MPDETAPADLASVNYTWGLIVGRLKDYAESGKSDPCFSLTRPMREESIRFT